MWPAASASVCWHCCSPVRGHPVLLPEIVYGSPRHVELYGHFCCFSCAKAWSFYSRRNVLSGEARHCLALMAFVGYHRPKYCPLYPDTIFHSSSCPCLERWRGIPMAPRRETLPLFGGDDSRKEEWEICHGTKLLDPIFLEKMFLRNDRTNSHSILRTVGQRELVFREGKMSMAMIKEEELGEPVVIRKRRCIPLPLC